VKPRKNKVKLYIFGLISLTALSGCRLIDAIRDTVDSSEPSFNSSSDDGDTSFTSVSTSDGDTTLSKSSRSRHLYREVQNAQYLEALPSTGNQKVLVVPVDFSDYPASSLPLGAEGTRSKINTAFFGAASETGWQSVKSFYYESSYGRLNLTGEVLPWFRLSITSSQLKTKTSYYDPTYFVLDEIRAKYPDKMREYDQDGNGFVDAIIMIYSKPYETPTDTDSLYWAYTYWYQGVEPNYTTPYPNVYGWASYKFMDDGYGSNVIDAHTYIHEFGHVLGLDDYYNYDDTPHNMAGGVDMMAYNIIDHNMFSKYALGWAEPYYVNKNMTLKIKPAHSSGDFIILKDNFKNTAFDEYLLIEYYQPKGLNYRDSITRYPGNGIQGQTVNGIRIWHIDARLFLFNGSYNIVDPNAVDYIKNYDGVSFTAVGASNTPSYSLGDKIYLAHLMEATGINSFEFGEVSSNITLFKEGQVFKASSTFFKNGTYFNDGSRVGYEIQIGRLTADDATITIKRI
jgi:M6 family metalloprotease-like protein